MRTNRLTVREARRTISTILVSGKTVHVGDNYGRLRGFIVGLPDHEPYNAAEKKKALREAKLQFQKAWIEEAQG
jgi:hypothetical protein